MRSKECVSKTKNKTLVFEENGRRVVFQNSLQKELTRVSVDGCYIDDDSQRCDFMCLLGSRAWYIELKGRDYEKALRQIVSTISMIDSDFPNDEVIPVIVTSKSPAIAGFQKAYSKIQKESNIPLAKPVLRTRVAEIRV